MRKKHLFLIFLFFSVLLFIGACNKEKDNIEIDDNSSKVLEYAYNSHYNAYVGDEFYPFIESESLDIKSSNNDVIDIVDSKLIRCKKEGIVRIYKYINNKPYCYVTVEVSNLPTVKPNYSSSLVEEFKNKLDSYDFSNSLEIRTSLDMNGKHKQLHNEFMNDPFYFSGNDEIGNGYFIQKEEDGYYKYTYDNYLWYYKTYLGDLNYDISEYNSLNYNSIEVLKSLDYNAVEIEKTRDENYILKFKNFQDIKEISNDYWKEQIENDALKDENIYLELIVSFNEVSITLFGYIKTHYIKDNILNNNKYNFISVYDFDVLKKEIKSLKQALPLKIDDANILLESNDIYIVGSNQKGYIYKYFEEGIYSIDADNTFLNRNLKINIYNNNKELLDNNSTLNWSRYNCSFSILEAGYYYVELDSGLYFLDATIVKHSYNINEEELKSDSGHIDGKYDYVVYKYESNDEDELLKITNKSNNKLYCYYEVEAVLSDSYLTHTILPNQYIYINPDNGNFNFYVVEDQDDTGKDELKYAYDYEFSFESIIDENGKDYDNLDEIKNIYNYDKNYFISGTYKPVRFILNVEELGYYKFIQKNENKSEKDLYVNIYYKDLYYNNKNEILILQKGQYILEVASNSFDISYVKYELDIMYIYDIDIKVLDISKDKYNDDSAYNFIAPKVNNKAIYKFNFTLDNDCYLLLYPNQMTIYDEYGNQKTFDYMYTKLFYFKFKKGNYYVFLNDNQPSFYLAMTSKEPNFYIDLDKDNNFEFNKSYILEDDSFFVISTEEDVTINIKSGYKYYLFDEKMNQITDKTLILKANKKYYVFVNGYSYLGLLSDIPEFFIEK